MDEMNTNVEIDNKNLEIFKTNYFSLTGIVSSEQEFSHEVFGEGFYKFTIETKRLSDASDFLPVVFSERLCNRQKLTVGTPIEIIGQIRSYNSMSQNSSKNKLLLTVFPKDLKILDEVLERDKNEILLKGFICRKPIFRTTPFGREIADVLVAVNRQYNKSDYIPIIAWGRNARYAGGLEVGDEISIAGRMQSRNYQKKISEDEFEEKVAYEISVSKIDAINIKSRNNDENNENSENNADSSEE